jgi:hypothetical protein
MMEQHHFLWQQEGHLEIVKILLEHGALIDKATTYGATSLFTAPQEGFGDCKGVAC